MEGARMKRERFAGFRAQLFLIYSWERSFSGDSSIDSLSQAKGELNVFSNKGSKEISALRGRKTPFFLKKHTQARADYLVIMLTNVNVKNLKEKIHRAFFIFIFEIVTLLHFISLSTMDWNARWSLLWFYLASVLNVISFSTDMDSTLSPYHLQIPEGYFIRTGWESRLRLDTSVFTRAIYVFI